MVKISTRRGAGSGSGQQQQNQSSGGLAKGSEGGDLPLPGSQGI